MKNTNNYKFLKLGLIIVSICFLLPSLIFFINNGFSSDVDSELEFRFLLSYNISRTFQALVYAILLIAFLIFYYLIIKKRKEIFKDIKEIYIFTFIIGIIFLFILPFWCSDIYYYLGIGRLNSKYHQNPYYVDMKSYIDENNTDISKDTLMQKGYKNFWANTTVVYGPIWTIICSIVAFFSFGKLNIGLLLFKFINLFIHIMNCHLLYRLSKKKIFPLLYGINPFILIEGLSNVHNDMFVVFFILLSLFLLLKKNNLVLSLLSLAMATDIKYFPILLLPLLIIYKYKDKDIKTKICKCISFGLLYMVFVGIPYLIYMKDINVFMGLITQRERYAKGLYLVILKHFAKSFEEVGSLKNYALLLFFLMYVINCIFLLISKNLKFYKENRTIFGFTVAFLFFLITNFQPWYFMWLIPFIIWQKSDTIKLIIQMQILTLIANIIFLIYSEGGYQDIFFTIFVLGIGICVLINKKVFIKIKDFLIEKKRNNI